MKQYLVIACVLFSVLFFHTARGQIRFYSQYRTIPFVKGGSSDFRLLSGVKLDPNKEVVVALGIGGNFTPKGFKGDLTFRKSAIGLGFNYYLSRSLYLNTDVNLNLLNDIVNNAFDDDTIINYDYFLDYQVNLTVIILRRLHFSMATGIVDFSELLLNTLNDLAFRGSFKPNIALSLKLYMFQIKF